jgi:hypothetical protein
MVLAKIISNNYEEHRDGSLFRNMEQPVVRIIQLTGFMMLGVLGGGGGGNLVECINFPLHKASYVLQIVTTCPSSSNVHARPEM